MTITSPSHSSLKATCRDSHSSAQLLSLPWFLCKMSAAIQDIKMNWQILGDQGARKGGGIEPSECVECLIGKQEFAQAMMYHLQCLDTFYFNFKQSIFHKVESAVREFAHWYPQVQSSGREIS